MGSSSLLLERHLERVKSKQHKGLAFSLFFLVATLSLADAQHCYSCAGKCHNEHCNCQMGSCHAQHCFIERAPTDVQGVYRITKGCLRRPSRTILGCDQEHFRDHILCVCKGDFCNDHIFIRSVLRRNVTCRKCSERNPDCDDTCQGQWCHEDSTTGNAGCGFGPPSLPFYYKGPELLYYRNKLCITMTRGASPPRKHCICNTNHCNQILKFRQSSDGALRSRSLISHTIVDPVLPLFECVNCDVSATQDAAITPSCMSSRCVGHFCTLTAQRIWPSGGLQLGGGVSMSGRPVQPFPSVTERQGCLNVTDSTQIQLGCSHKWMNGEFEELQCACRGHLCNRDLTTASATALFPLFSLAFILLQATL